MKKLSRAFDYQRLQQNSRLAVIISDVESRYAKAALSDEELGFVHAAGDVHAQQTPEKALLPEEQP